MSDIFKEEFKQRCLRNLGAPVNQINVTNDQIEDAVQDALDLYIDHHYDGSEIIYIFHEISNEDKTKQRIELPPGVQSVVQILDADLYGIEGDPLFDNVWHLSKDAHQLAANTTSLGSYAISMSYLNLLEQMFDQAYMWRFNKVKNHLQMSIDWAELPVGKKIVIKAYSAIDPADYPEVYGDRWLRQYATALIQYRWAMNLGKYKEISLPGGVTLDVDGIKEEAQEALTNLKENLMDEFTYPVDFFTG